MSYGSNLRKVCDIKDHKHNHTTDCVDRFENRIKELFCFFKNCQVPCVHFLKDCSHFYLTVGDKFFLNGGKKVCIYPKYGTDKCIFLENKKHMELLHTSKVFCSCGKLFTILEGCNEMKNYYSSCVNCDMFEDSFNRCDSCWKFGRCKNYEDSEGENIELCNECYEKVRCPVCRCANMCLCVWGVEGCKCKIGDLCIRCKYMN